MPATTNSVLGLVEFSNAGSDDTHSRTTSQILHDAFGHRLNGWVRTNDQWSFLNDNRACVILRDIAGPRELEMAAAQLDSVFSEPHYHLGQALPLAVTAGFTEFSDQNSDLALAMQEAAIALDQAKQSRDLFQVFCAQQANNRQEDRKLLEQIEAALQANQFQLHYQPQVDAGNRSLIGAEAIIHWHNSEHGIITPEKFVELTQGHEIIKPITRWAIKSAVSRLAHWPQQLSIALNICPNLLLEDDTLQMINDALTAFDVKPSRLTLEISESIKVSNQELLLTQLAKLHDMGVTLSIDNFGRGCSSLQHYSELTVDSVKIDPSFIERMLVSEKDYAIVKAIIDLAHSFSLKVAAEGVQSIAIADRLTQMRCDTLQGCVFDNPLPVEEFVLEYRI